MKKPQKNNNINLDPYEDVIKFEKLDPYESLIRLNLLLKKNSKCIE